MIMADQKKLSPSLGSGMAEDAKKKVRVTPAYKEYQMMKYSSGEKPVSMDDWLKGKR
jgi:hypothetical protein